MPVPTRLALLLAVASVAAMAGALIPGSRPSGKAALTPATGGAPDVPVPSYVVVDAETGAVLAARAPDARRPVASLTKLMTARLVLARGHLDDPVRVASAAATVGESSVGLRPGSVTTRRVLLEAALVASGNDAAEALALDAAAGDEWRFVDRMNAEARRLGMGETRYGSPHGLERPGQASTARDQARLALALLRDPVLMGIVAERSVEVGGRTFAATNRLLGVVPGVDGMKTGHTRRAGWCLVATATRGGRRVLVVALGARSAAARDAAVGALLDWGLLRLGAGSRAAAADGTVAA